MPPQSNSSPTTRDTLILTSLFAAAFFVYLIVWKSAPYATYDTVSYQLVAQDLQDGRLDHLHDRTLGYPLILLLTQSSVHPSKSLFVLQLLLHFAAVWMLVTALSQHGVSRKFVLSFAVLSVSPPFLCYAAYALTESVLAFFVVLIFCGLRQWLLFGSRSWLAASLTGTICCGVVRPSLFALGIPCAILLAIWRRADTSESIPKVRLRTAQHSLVLFPLLACAVMIGFNVRRFHYAGLTPMMWKYLSTKTVRLTERIPDSEPVKEYLVATRDQALLKPNSFHNGQAYMHDLDNRTLSALTGIIDEGELARYLTRIQIRLIADSPMTYLLEVGGSMVTYWFPAKLAPHSSSGLLFYLWVIVDFGMIVAFLVMTILFPGVLFFLRQWKLSLGYSKETEAIRQGVLVCYLALALISYNAIISNLFSVGETRYRYPTDLLIVFFLVLSYEILRRIQRQIAPQHEATASSESPDLE